MFSDIFNLWNVIKCYQMSHFGDIVKTKVTLNVPLFEGYLMLPNVTKCCKMLPNVGTISPDTWCVHHCFRQNSDDTHAIDDALDKLGPRIP